MNSAPMIVAIRTSGLKVFAGPAARQVPTATGASAAGSVLGREALTQTESAPTLWSLRVLAEVGFALLDVRISAFLAFLAHVEEQCRVASQLLHASHPIRRGVEGCLEHPQRQGREL